MSNMKEATPVAAFESDAFENRAFENDAFEFSCPEHGVVETRDRSGTREFPDKCGECGLRLRLRVVDTPDPLSPPHRLRRLE